MTREPSPASGGRLTSSAARCRSRRWTRIDLSSGVRRGRDQETGCLPSSSDRSGGTAERTAGGGVERRLRRGWRNLAFLPIIEILDGARRLSVATDAETAPLRRALDGTSRQGAAELAAAEPGGRAATFVRLREMLVDAAGERDVVVVIDDLHWADRSTLDVVSFLARRLAGTGVLLVLAYRSDELSRRHPLKPVLAELVRHATLDHLRLEPLSPSEVRAQVAAILAGEPESSRLDRVVRLADGNPFPVEELLSLTTIAGCRRRSARCSTRASTSSTKESPARPAGSGHRP
jgi:hypothetical protein